jgi:thiamine monophosphate synthase
VEIVSEGSGVVRLLEKEPTKAERYAHAAELLAIIQRADAQAATQQLDRVALTTA